MILQSLDELYHRLSSDPQYEIPRPGYSTQKIVFRVVLKPDGSLHGIEDARVKDDKGRLRPRQLLVPGHTKPSGSGLNPCFLWDTSQYMLGYKLNDENPKRTTEAFNSFRKKHLDHEPEIQIPAYRAVCRFLESWEPQDAARWPVLNDIGPGYGVFQMIGLAAHVHDEALIRSWWLDHTRSGQEPVMGQCLVSGKTGPIARLQYKIKKVGSQGESQIVAFNASAFESYGKRQSFNAPISDAAAFRYATALNALLDGPKSHRHRFTLGEATVVFWTGQPTAVEDIFAPFALDGMEAVRRNEAQDEATRERLELFLRALRHGRAAYADLERDTDRISFYLLGLTGQARGRIGVRFFYTDTLSVLIDNLRRHYADLHIVRRFEDDSKHPDPEFPTLRQILDETCPRRNGKPDRDHIPPILEGPLLRAVIVGTQYPNGLYSAIMRRIVADRDITYVRASIIAGYFRRNLKQEVAMSLDVERKEPAYRLGRLFALVEKVQGDALGTVNATVRDRFYSGASATPGVVFPRLLRTYQHHLAKLPQGLKISRERLAQDILAPVKDLPPHLGLAEQGLFALGYYHQTKELWTSKAEKNKETRQ